jgi:DNA-binding beta-propeller fold protein YncE
MFPAADAGLPPEVEEQRAFETPQAGARFVYVANPRRDNVAVIDSRTLAIQSVEAGDGPTYLVTVPERDGMALDEALVINVNASTATLLRTNAAGVTTTAQMPVVAGANAIAVAPNGHYAVVYLDTSRPNQGVPAGSFQEVAVLRLDPGMERGLLLSVGFRPVSVVFSADGQTGFVITEDGVSILRFASLTGPALVPTVSFYDDHIVAPGDAGMSDAGTVVPRDARAQDVSVTRDGRYAIARFAESRAMRVVDLMQRTVQTIDLGTEITDLDVAPDGTFALAALRNESRVLRIPIPAGFSDPSVRRSIDLPGELVGSITMSPDGARALVYSTAAMTERATLLDLAGTAAPAVLRLRKTVRAVAFAPGGESALIVHGRSEGSPTEPGIDLETQIDRSYGYSLLNVAERFTRLQLTPADVGPFALVPGGTHAFVLLRDDARHIALAQRITLASLTIQDIALGSPPVSVGAVPATERAFIGQDHPEGRITFVDWNTGAQQSITGFELNSRIVE